MYLRSPLRTASLKKSVANIRNRQRYIYIYIHNVPLSTSISPYPSLPSSFFSYSCFEGGRTEGEERERVPFSAGSYKVTLPGGKYKLVRG